MYKLNKKKLTRNMPSTNATFEKLDKQEDSERTTREIDHRES